MHAVRLRVRECTERTGWHRTRCWKRWFLHAGSWTARLASHRYRLWTLLRPRKMTRTGAGLSEAAGLIGSWLEKYSPPATRRGVELANMLYVGHQMVLAGLIREESRGAHYRADFPATLPEWRRRRAVRLAEPSPLR